MDKNEYETLKAKLIETYGKPVYDMREPQNEAAVKLNELKTQFRLDTLARSRNERRELKLKDVIADVPADKLREVVSVPILGIAINDSHLINFSPKERDILISHYNNLNLTHTQLAREHGVSRQYVTGLIDSPANAVLRTKVMDKVLPLETSKALLRLLKADDRQVALRVAEHYKIIANNQTDLNIVNKPIDDPEAIKLLKELGDKLAGS